MTHHIVTDSPPEENRSSTTVSRSNCEKHGEVSTLGYCARPTVTAAPRRPTRLPGLFQAMVGKRLRLDASPVQSDVISQSTAVTSHSSRIAVRAKRALGQSPRGGRQGCGMPGHATCLPTEAVI